MFLNTTNPFSKNIFRDFFCDPPPLGPLFSLSERKYMVVFTNACFCISLATYSLASALATCLRKSEILCFFIPFLTSHSAQEKHASYDSMSFRFSSSESLFHGFLDATCRCLVRLRVTNFFFFVLGFLGNISAKEDESKE